MWIFLSMKKTFLATRNRLLSSSQVSWGTGALVLVLTLLLLRLVAPNIFWYTVAPLFHGADTLARKSHIFLSAFGNTATLALQNQKLVEENIALVNENSALLQRIVDVSRLEVATRGVVAGVVAGPPVSPYDTLVVTAGRDKGVTPGMGAYGAGGVPLGTVSSADAHFSRVTLFSSPGVETHGWVGNERTALIIFGAGGGAMKAEVSRSVGVLVGDSVFSPGPGRVPIGLVVRVDTNPSSPSVTIRIQPLQNIFSIAWVLLRDTGSTLLP